MVYLFVGYGVNKIRDKTGMATTTEVKDYIAQWMQLGKKIILNDRPIGTTEVLHHDHYSAEFEQMWAQAAAAPSKAYLDGTDQSIANLLDPKWDMSNCVRCGMLAPCIEVGPRETAVCPCADLELWPDLETVTPRSPVSSDVRLHQIHDRILRATALHEENQT